MAGRRTRAAVDAHPACAGTPAGAIEPEVRQLARLIPRVFRGLKRAGQSGAPAPLRDRFELSTLGPRHVPALVFLALDGPMSVTELAQALGLTVATASLMVGELDREGLVDRHEDSDDRRRTVVSVSPEHRQLIEAWAEERRAPLRRALARMSPAARAQFLEGWRMLAEEIEASGDPGGRCAV